MVVTEGGESHGRKGRRKGQRGRRSGRLNQVKRQTHEANRDKVAITNIGTDPSSLLASTMGKELHHTTLSMLWGYGGRL